MSGLSATLVSSAVLRAIASLGDSRTYCSGCQSGPLHASGVQSPGVAPACPASESSSTRAPQSALVEPLSIRFRTSAIGRADGFPVIKGMTEATPGATRRHSLGDREFTKSKGSARFSYRRESLSVVLVLAFRLARGQRQHEAGVSTAFPSPGRRVTGAVYDDDSMEVSGYIFDSPWAHCTSHMNQGVRSSTGCSLKLPS